MKDLESFVEKIHHAYKLKFEYRYGDLEVGGGRESVSAHTWATLLLSDYFLHFLEQESPGKYRLDKLKIYDYLIYHDLVEAQVGDIDNSRASLEKRKTKEENEKAGTFILSQKLPEYIGQKFSESFSNYENEKDIEAKFSKCIDVLEGQIHSFNSPDLWKGWTPSYHKQRFYRKCFDSFPKLQEILYQIHESFIERGYFEKDE